MFPSFEDFTPEEQEAITAFDARHPWFTAALPYALAAFIFAVLIAALAL